MATKYDLRQGFLGENFDPANADDVNYLSYSPTCLIAVVPYTNPVTYSRAQGASATNNAYDGINTKDLIVIDTDVLMCSVNQSKASPVGSMSASLSFSDIEYLNVIYPNDWVFAWIVYGDEKKESLKQRLQNGQSCNLFSDGLKFVGRVSSIRKSFIQNAGGPRQVAYTLQGNSFKEMDTTVFYDPFFQENVAGVFQYMSRLSKGVNDLFDPTSKNGAEVTTLTAFVTFLDLIVGSGIATNSFSDGLNLAIPQTQLPKTDGEGEANFAFCVPNQVGSILNKADQTKVGGVACYADIMELLIGVQNYSEQQTSVKGGLTDSQAGLAFAPSDIDQAQSTQRRYTGKPLLGTFEPDPPVFSNRSLWTILNQYLNSAVNEMYTTLRVNPAGYVVPTLVVRQFPFNSSLIPQSTPITQHLDVPRWAASPLLITGADLGRSDALHFNFVHIYGDATQQNPGGAAETRNRLENPPKIDSLDVKRSGIRMYPLQTVNCSGVDVQNQSASRWMEIVADFSINQQMTLTGSINMMGIQDPIAVGDNLDFDNTVFHIEEVAHQFSLAGGARRFVTSVSVTHGVRADSTDVIAAHASAQFPDLFLYQGVLPGDMTDNDPGLTTSTPHPQDFPEIDNGGLF